MTTAVASEVEIDPALKDDAAVLSGVHEATNYLLSRSGFSSAGVEVRWRLATERLDGSVEVQLTDNNGDSSLIAGKVFPVAHLMNPVYRDIWVLRAWRDLLSLRMARNEQVIERMIQNMEDCDDGGAVQRADGD